MPGWFVLLATAICGAAGVGLVVRAALRSRSRTPVPAAVASPIRARRLRPTGRSAAAAAAAPPVDLDHSRLVGWRFGRLLGAGVEARLALRLAERVDIDIHEVMTLVGGGCPAPLAARIAEPLEL